MPDSLDIVLERYEQESKARLDHANMLSKWANSLVNMWPQEITPLLEATNIRLRKFGLVIQGFEQKLSPDGKAVGSSFAVWGMYPNPLEPRQQPAKLTFKLTNAGGVRALIAGAAGPAGCGEREKMMSDAMPTEWVNDVLADYVDYCLRVGWK